MFKMCLIFSSLFITNLAISDHAMAYNFAKYDLSVYGNFSWLPADYNVTDYEYSPDTNFWVHYYDIDESYTHTGEDYNLGSAGDSNKPVLSPGFGTLVNDGSEFPGTNAISIQHLLDCGEVVFANLLHTKDIEEIVQTNRYVVKGQKLAMEGNVGATGTPYHLHLEYSNTGNSSAWIDSDFVYPHSNPAPPLQPVSSTEMLDSLVAHGLTNGEQIWYSPTSLVNTYYELFPYLSRTSTSPNLSSYDVYGVAQEPLHGALRLKRLESTKSYHAIGIVVREGLSRYATSSISIEDGKWLAQSWPANELWNETRNQQTIPVTYSSDNETEFLGNYSYEKGDYQFRAFISDSLEQEHHEGYQVTFSVVDEGDFIIDNDQMNDYPLQKSPAYFGTAESKVPGYFFTADLNSGRSGTSAQWYPHQEGYYNIYVHVPEYGATAINVRYEISQDSICDVEGNSILSDPINQVERSNQAVDPDQSYDWIPLTSNNGNNDIFYIDSTGSVELSLGNEDGEVNYEIIGDDKVAFDAVKFVRVDFEREVLLPNIINILKIQAGEHNVDTSNLGLSSGQGSTDTIPDLNSALFQSLDAIRKEEFGTVVIAGRVWMDQNLGASRVAQSEFDERAFGDYYQWGRGNDGHQNPSSPTTFIRSSTDSPGHGNFIVSDTECSGFFYLKCDANWRVEQNTNLWQGVEGINNPCPSGFRIPTAAEYLSWNIHYTYPYNGLPIKITRAGQRSWSDGSIFNSGGAFYSYWSSTVVNNKVALINNFSGDKTLVSYVDGQEGVGASVRCIKDEAPVIPTIKSPITGRIWMDRNLGANRAAVGATDIEAYGDLYQYGRFTDGHEKRSSLQTDELSNTNRPKHSNFIRYKPSTGSWVATEWLNDSTLNWTGFYATNNPCPFPFRLPTVEEFEAEQLSFSTNREGDLVSPLKLVLAGYRMESNGTIYREGEDGYYWTSNAGDGLDEEQSKYLIIGDSFTYIRAKNRASGLSVRCIQDEAVK